MKKDTIVKTILLYLAVAAFFAIPLVYEHITSLNNEVLLPVTKVTAATQTPKAAATTTSTPSTETTIYGQPVRLSIPRLGINLHIINGTYDTATKGWTLTSTNAQFATITSLPNNVTGDTLIYGHETAAVFEKTNDLVKGDILLIYTSNNHIFDYTYTSSKITSPTDTSVFSYQGGPRVTLLTCNGWFSQNRRLMYFTFNSVLQ